MLALKLGYVSFSTRLQNELKGHINVTNESVIYLVVFILCYESLTMMGEFQVGNLVDSFNRRVL